MRFLIYIRKQMDVSPSASAPASLVRELLAGGHEVRFVSGFKRRRPDLGLADVARFIPSVPIPFVNRVVYVTQAYVRMTLDVLRFRPDAVVTCPATVGPAALARAVARMVGRETVFFLDIRTIPIDTGRPRWDRIELRTFERAVRRAGRALDGMTAITAPLARIAEALSGLSSGSVGVWTSGVDVRQFDPGVCEEANHEVDGLRVLYHGGLLMTRGLDDAVRAIGLLRARGVEDVTLTLLGSGTDAEKLRELVRAESVEGAVSILPAVPVEEIPAVICQADVGLLPFPDLECWRVSSPLKLFEYLAMERPVIATRIECCTSVAAGAPYVVWADSSDPDDLADAMLRARDEIGELRAAARMGREMVLRDYTWQAQVERLVGFLKSARS